MFKEREIHKASQSKAVSLQKRVLWVEMTLLICIHLFEKRCRLELQTSTFLVRASFFRSQTVQLNAPVPFTEWPRATILTLRRTNCIPPKMKETSEHPVPHGFAPLAPSLKVTITSGNYFNSTVIKLHTPWNEGNFSESNFAQSHCFVKSALRAFADRSGY